MEIKQISAAETWELRRAVMWPDKPLSYVQLADDDQGLHYGLFDQDELVSVVSLFIQYPEAQFRKFATRTDLQGRGYGSRLLRFMLEEAGKYPVRAVWCNARVDKAAFYEKFGLEATDLLFCRDGQNYVIMKKQVQGRLPSDREPEF